MKNRILKLMDFLDISQTQFAEQIGVKRPIISHIVADRNNVSLDVVMKILSVYNQISPDWLIFGVGPMLRQGAEKGGNNTGAALNAKKVHHITIYYDDNTYNNYYPENKTDR